jgi:hypothetical protein
MFCKNVGFLKGVELLAQRLAIKLDDHHLSAVLESLPNAFAAICIDEDRFLSLASRYGVI